MHPRVLTSLGIEPTIVGGRHVCVGLRGEEKKQLDLKTLMITVIDPSGHYQSNWTLLVAGRFRGDIQGRKSLGICRLGTKNQSELSAVDPLPNMWTILKNSQFR